MVGFNRLGTAHVFYVYGSISTESMIKHYSRPAKAKIQVPPGAQGSGFQAFAAVAKPRNRSQDGFLANVRCYKHQ